LSIFIDEIDDLKNKEDVEGLLRKGQRRGNQYVRLNKNTLEEEIYEAFGIYGYTFRSEVEDAFKDRSILIRTAKAKDSRLSIINIEKRKFLKPLFNKIFFWYVQNIFNFGSTSSTSSTSSRGFYTEDKNYRDVFYEELTKDFTQEEIILIEKLLGRNSEIAFLFVKVCKLLGLNLLEEISNTITEKQEEDNISDSYYIDLMQEIFEEIILHNESWTLKKGDFAGYKYYPKTNFYIKLISKLKEHKLEGISTRKYNRLLKDIGFIVKYNIKNQKPKGSDIPKLCLIFTPEITENLGIKYEQEIPFKNEVVKIK